MIRLIRIELTRLRWRRAILVLLAAAIVVPLCIAGALAYETRPLTEADHERAEQEAAAFAAEPWVQDEVRRCVQRRTGQAAPDATALAEVEAACRERSEPRAEDFLYRPTLSLIEQQRETGTAVVLVLVVLTMLIGTTFAGADWNSGSMSNQLLFEVRRTRVWVAKAAAVLLASLVASGVVLAAYWTGLWAVALSRDQEIHDGILRILAGFSGRGLLLAGAATLGAYALTMLWRSTVTTLGALFAVAVVGSFLVGMLPLPDTERWTLHSNVLAVLYDGVHYWDDSRCEEPVSAGTCGDVLLTSSQATVYLGTMLGLCVLASLVSFRRRDVP